MGQMTASEARANLPNLLDRVADGEEITITRHGRPAGVLLHPRAVRSRRGEQIIEGALEIDRLITAARQRPLAPAALSAARAEELVAAVRAGRDRS